ncbi:MAG TPA: hypothetical protein PKY77_20765 [Phycisphaerae bacterium]|nr:hypothetical protein [Phycisphaerae bacterium]HSA29501.1 hypothetical protein [Phycisphaerae bacterium]
MGISMGEHASSTRAFPTTRWSWIQEARQEDAAGDRRLLDRLLRRYLPALRSHLFSRWSLPPEQADDLLQDFITNRVLEHDLLAAADERRGKFRTFLLTSLDRYAISRRRHNEARKRAGGRTVPLEETVASTGPDRHTPTDSSSFNVVWVQQVLKETLVRMQRQCRMGRQAQLWTVFEQRILQPMLEDAEPTDYETLARTLGYHSASQARNTLTTAKRMFVRVLRKVVGEYTQGEEQIASEIEELRETLIKAGAPL